MDDSRGVLVRLPPPPGVSRGPARPKRKPQAEDDLWLVSYGDLLTLLFCFFTLLLSVSSVDVAKMDRLKTQVQSRFGDKGEAQQGLAALQSQLEQVVREAGLGEDIHIRSSERGLVVDLNARILFPAASAELSEDAKDVLDSLAAPLKGRPVEIQVEGHTDPVPIQSPRFPSNWELSAARATGVVRYLLEHHQYEPSRLRAVGLAFTKPIDESGAALAAPPPKEQWTEAYLARQRRVSLVLRPVEAPAKVKDEGSGKAAEKAPAPAKG